MSNLLRQCIICLEPSLCLKRCLCNDSNICGVCFLMITDKNKYNCPLCRRSRDVNNGEREFNRCKCCIRKALLELEDK